MKTTITLIICLISINLFSQKIEMDYYPKKNETVTNKDYSKGIEDLSYAYNDIKRRNSSTFDYIDYWRIAIAYSYLGVDNDKVYEIFLKSKNDNKKGFCIILNHQLDSQERPIEKTRFYKFLGRDYIEELSDCSDVDLRPVKNNKSEKSWFKKEGEIYKWRAKTAELLTIDFDKRFNNKNTNKFSKTKMKCTAICCLKNQKTIWLNKKLIINN